MKKSQIQLSIKAKLKNIETIRKAVYRAIKSIINHKTTYGFTVSKPLIHKHSKTLKHIFVSFNTPLFAVSLRETFEQQRQREETAFNEMKKAFDVFVDNLNYVLSTTKSYLKVDEW